LIFSVFEQVGTYNPIANKDNIKEITANTERVRYWLSCGAQPSDRVAWLFGRIGLLPAAPVRQSVQEAVPKMLRAKK
jgi:small subunit ribosomal protein S16